MNTIEILSTVLMVVGGLTIVTNIITEVLKRLFWDVVPTNALVVIIAIVLTMGSGAAYAAIMATPIFWYHIAAAAVVSMFVAYAAMFGFDKLKQALEQIGGNYGKSK